MRSGMKVLAVLTLLTVLFGCAGKSVYMREVTEPNATYAPQSDEAVVIFMRPSKFAWAIQAGLFDVTTEENKVVGILSAAKKVPYRTTPGKHMFMVTGESADFMRADLEAGKTYYAIVKPRMGAWKARFSLDAVHNDVDQAELNKWLSGCNWVESTPETLQWAQKNNASIQKKREDYIGKWQGKPDHGKPTLSPQDGF